jgi:hypothetical protein
MLTYIEVWLLRVQAIAHNMLLAVRALNLAEAPQSTSYTPYFNAVVRKSLQTS